MFQPLPLSIKHKCAMCVVVRMPCSSHLNCQFNINVRCVLWCECHVQATSTVKQTKTGDVCCGANAVFKQLPLSNKHKRATCVVVRMQCSSRFHCQNKQACDVCCGANAVFKPLPLSIKHKCAMCVVVRMPCSNHFHRQTNINVRRVLWCECRVQATSTVKININVRRVLWCECRVQTTSTVKQT